MTLDPSSDQHWLMDFENFFNHWEKEVEELKAQELGLDDCCKISEDFHRSWDGLLVRRSISMSEEDFARFQQLDSKLNSALAMVCGCSRKSE